MEQKIRQLARRFLPTGIRKRLGWLAGTFNVNVVHRAFGLCFDLGGGMFRADGCTFEVPRNVTTTAYRSCFLSGKYELEERQLVQRWIRSEDHVIELGGCLGIVSCVTNKILARRDRHVTVEANPLCIPSLYRNRAINKAGFLIEHCAVTGEPGQTEATFFLHPTYIVGGTVQRPTDRPVRLPAKTLHQLEVERGPFTALIIDIEGSEREVFDVSQDLLRHYRIVIVELHEWAIGRDGVERCREILKESGLRLVDSAGITEAWVRP